MIWLFVGLIAGVVLIDLVTKFSFDGILNSGIAWGLGAQLSWLWVVIVVLSLVLAVVLAVWYSRTKRRQSYWFTVGLALLIGGILGNAIDRMVTGGAVHDFINFVIFKNNLADITITVGAIMVGGHVALR